MEQVNPTLAASALGDAYSNFAAQLGFGTPNMVAHGHYSVDRISLDYQRLLELYRGSWIVRNVVDVLAEDALKSFPTLNCDVTAEEVSDFERLVAASATEDKVLQAYKWGRLFGGAIAIMCLDGDTDWQQPLDIEEVTPGSYKGLLVLDRWSGVSPSAKLISDLKNPAEYGLPEYYQCSTETGQAFTVHHSRVLRFAGRDLPQYERQIQSYWGLSEVEVVYEELKKRDFASWSMASLMSRANIMVLKEPMLAQAMSGVQLSAQQQADYVARLQMLSQSMSNMGLLAIGEGSELQQNQYSFGGMADVYSSFMLDIAGACEIPVSRLYGRTVTGLGQSGEGDLQIYYDKIAQKQKRDLRPQMHKLFPVMAMSAWGRVPDDLDFVFAQVRSLSEESKVDLAGKRVDAILKVLESPTPLMSPRTAARELKRCNADTGVFTSWTDEEIEALPDALPEDKSELALPPMETEDGNTSVPGQPEAGE